MPTVAMLLDAIEQRGVDAAAQWAGLPVTPADVRAGRGRIDWEVWVELMERAEAHFGTADLFVRGAGARIGHPFVQIANAFLTLNDVYALFVRWGLTRTLTVVTGRFTPAGDDGRATLAVDIDRTRRGSPATMHFIAGVVRELPTLQGLRPAGVTLDADASGHHATYRLALPPERGRLARIRRVVGVVGGAAAALDELERQATEIAAQNRALTEQLAASERAAAEARAREALLALAIDAGQVGTWRYDVATRQVWLSALTGRMLGLAGETEHPADLWAARVHGDDRPMVTDTVRRALDDGSPFAIEYRVVHPDGRVAWLAVNGQRVAATADQPAQLLGTAIDISAHRLLDTRLRTADRLIAAGTLAAGVAHEVSNPLTYVMGNVDLMRLRLGDSHPELTAPLAHVRDGLERIRDVVADLRAFACPDERVAGRVEPRAVCEAALRIVASMVRHRADVTTDYAADTPAVIANESRLGHVLINLVVNAAHAMPERPLGGNRVVVRTRRLPTGEAVIEVIDNGTGIAPEVVPRLFDPFFTTKPIGEGTGLGLSVCQSIVAGLGGRIDVTTALGVGSTFAVVLPAAPAIEVAGAAEAAPPAAPVGRRALVIDDEPVVRRVVSAMLASQGFEVVEAADGAGGLTLAGGERPFDVVLCDLMMPDVDGVAVHAAMAASHPERLGRLLFITGGAVSGRTAAFVERGDVRVLPKPFTVGDLTAAIAALDRTDGGAAR